jgi:hypothetical protein
VRTLPAEETVDMEIVVTRADAHRYSTVVERDGVRLRVPGYGFMRALPHDLAHFVVEDTLRLSRGFWGSVASGAEFRGMERIDGRRKPHATRRPKTTSKDNADYLSEAERLVACFERIVDGELDRFPQRTETELRLALATVQHGTKAISRSAIEGLCAAWRAMQARWNELPVGEAVRLEWRPTRAPGRA